AYSSRESSDVSFERSLSRTEPGFPGYFCKKLIQAAYQIRTTVNQLFAARRGGRYSVSESPTEQGTPSHVTLIRASPRPSWARSHRGPRPCLRDDSLLGGRLDCPVELVAPLFSGELLRAPVVLLQAILAARFANVTVVELADNFLPPLAVGNHRLPPPQRQLL